MKSNAALDSLIEALRRFPGVGPKTAQRMAFHLLQRDRDGLAALSQACQKVLATVHHCVACNTFTESEYCELCVDEERDHSILCVVETPADLHMVEQTLSYRGLYFVLMGRLSPLDGIGPKDIAITKLVNRVSDGIVTEVILATNFTNEGEATAHYVGELLKSQGLKVTRLARGVPAGGELEYVDAGTLTRAMLDRR